jgi:purine-nucleoside phosphorylase
VSAAEQPLGEFERAERAAEYLRSKTKQRPQVAVVLGSGLGGFADQLRDAARISYADIPHFPRPTAEGHAGNLVVGEIGGATVAVMQGRVHGYEGLSVKDVVFPVRVLGRFGIRALVLTNAAGGINPTYQPGSLVMLRDHISTFTANPLVGPNDPRFGLRFFDMTRPYDDRFREIAAEEAKRAGIELHEGVFVALSGPSYETPAEIRMLSRLGADLVGMSTVPEVIAARHMGVRVLAISCVSNAAAGVTGEPLNHEEVLEVGRQAQGKVTALLSDALPRLAAEVAA